jgi:hypothetical protein
MKIKKGCDASSDEFWYDLTDGGGLDPMEICESEEDARRVIEAIAIVKEFQDSCEEQIEDFIQ